MANEFVARNGLIAQDNSNITGSLKVTSKISIGTDYAGFPLNVAGVAYVIGGSVWVNDGYGLVNATSPNTGIYPDSTHNITIKNNNNSTVYIKSDGNVGIGTTAPSTKFEINTPTYTTFTGTSNVARFNALAGTGAATALLLTNYVGDLSTDTTVDLDFAAVDGNSLLGSIPHVRIGYTGLYNPGINIDPGSEARGYFRIATRTEGSGGILTDKIVVDYLGNSLFLSGSVGIGTTSPGYKLDVSGSIRIPNSQYIYMNSVAGTATQILGVDSGDNTVINTPTGGDIYIRSAGNTIARFISSGTVYLGGTSATSSPRVAILTGGSVGIGTTSPISILDVRGATYISGTLSVGTTSTAGSGLTVGGSTILLSFAEIQQGNTFYFYNSGNTSYTTLQQNGLNFLIQPINGNVGIGTTNPSLAKLQVQGNVWAQSFTGSFSGSAVAPGTNTQVIFNSSGSLAASSGFVFTGASVGIGTTSPAERLHVDAGSGIGVRVVSSTFSGIEYHNVNGTWKVYVGTETGGGGARYNSADSQHTFYNNSSQVVRINSSGNLLVGNSNNYTRLSISNGTSTRTGLTLSDGNTASLMMFAGSSSLASISFDTFGLRFVGGSTAGTDNGTEFMRITTAGSIGIGTTSPGEKLQVQGNVRFGTGGQASWGNGLLAVTNSWDGGASSYPTIGSYGGSVGSLIMLINPHTPFRTDNASSGYTGRSGLRMSANASATTYWDAGLAGDFYHIFRQGTGEFLRINSSGSVGIGTTSPTEKLHLNNSTGTGTFIRFQDTSGGGVYIGGRAERMELYAGGSERIRIASDGNVGIGTTAPEGKLHVYASAVRNMFGVSTIALPTSGDEEGVAVIKTNSALWQQSIVGYAADSKGLRVYNTGGSTYTSFEVVQGGGSRLIVAGSGNVGIGTTAPAAKLDVVGTSGWTGVYASSGARFVAIASDSAAQNDINWDSSSDLRFSTATNKAVSGYSEKMRITSAGRVGIGTTAPERVFHVVGDAVFSGTSAGIYFKSNTNNPFIWVEDAQSLRLGTNNTERVRITSDGAVGIGTSSPSGHQLDIASSQGGANNSAIRALYPAGGGLANTEFGALAYRNSAWTAVYGKQGSASSAGYFDGNVGIGTSIPSARLQVSGSSNTVNVKGSGSALFSVDGTVGRLFQVDDSLSGSLFSVNTAAGLPVIEAFSDNTVRIGQFGQRALFVSQSRIGIGLENPTANLHISGTTGGVFEVDGRLGVNALYVSSSGAVGIGTTNPGAYSFYVNGGQFGTLLKGGDMGVGSDIVRMLKSNDSIAMIVRGDGNVGIGSTAPGATLDVVGNVRAQSFTGSFSGSAAAPGSNTNVVYNNSGVLAGSNSFVFNGTNVGIGTTSPSTTLDVAGTGRFSGNVSIVSSSLITYSNSYGNNGLIRMFGTDGIEKYQQGLTTGGDFYQYTFGGLNHIFYTNNGSERMRITSAGNVGIGTTSPGSKLTVIGDIATSTRVAADTINGYTGGSTPLTIQTGGAQNIIFGTNATERMRLDTNGNLGVGVSVPIAKLHVGVNLSDYSTQTFTNTGAIITSIGVDQTGSRTNVLSLMRDGTSGVVYAGLAAFDISRWSADTVNARTQLDIRLANTDTATLTDVLSLRSNGTVGINTTAPTASLDVLGTGNYSVSAGGASTTATALTLTNTNDNASNGVRIAWKQATATYETAYISSVREGANSYSSLILATSPVSWNSAAPIERMRITSAGNVAINTTVANYKFQVNTAISSSQTYGISIQQGTNGANKDAAAFGVAIQNSGEATNAADLLFATATGGSLSERMRITSGGNVGIGTTAPLYSLDAYNTGASTARIRIVGATNYTLLQAQNNSGVLYTGIDDSAGSGFNLGGYSRLIWSSNAYPLVFAVNDAERMRITSGGSVGIGTTTPTANLHVSGTTGGLFEVDGVNGINSLYVSSSGNVGIGTTTIVSGARLHVNGYATTPNNLGWCGLTSAGALVQLLVLDSNNKTQIGTTTSATVMTLTGTSVGIGTTTPTVRLEVSGGSDLSTAAFVHSGLNGGLNVINNSTLAANRDSQLRLVNGTTYFGANDRTYQIVNAGTSATAADLFIQYWNGSSYAERMRITSGGNVGIGSASPAYPLDVNGTARVTSLIETSTREKKDNIQSYSTDINKFKQLEPVSFTWKDTGKSDVGLIAEEVDQLFPEFVSKTDEGEVTGINYGKLTTILINIVKQQQERIEKLEQQINK